MTKSPTLREEASTIVRSCSSNRTSTWCAASPPAPSSSRRWARRLYTGPAREILGDEALTMRLLGVSAEAHA
ncbi:MAG: hypothetical protein R2692_08265 [Microbacterium sp.]